MKFFFIIHSQYFYPNYVTNSSLEPGETYEFYRSGGPGFKLINEENYPESIKTFLSDELCYIIKILSEGKYYVLLEIWSANSIKALTIVQKNYKYYGIDVCSRSNPKFCRESYLIRPKLN